MPDLSSLRKTLKIAAKAFARFSREPIQLELGRRATDQQIHTLEKSIARKLPVGLARLFQKCSASIEFSWMASKKIPVPIELYGINSGGCNLSLEMVRTNLVNWSGWEDCFANPDDYASGKPRFAFKALFPVLSTPNGDEIVTVVKGPKKGEVYYLNHEGGDMDWARLACTLPDFFATWFGLGCPGPESDDLRPFYDGESDQLSLKLPESRAWRRALGLDGKSPERVAALDKPEPLRAAPREIDEPWFPVDGKKGCGYINRAGKLVLSFRKASLGRFYEDRASIEIRDRNGFIDRTGAYIVKPTYQWVGDFSEGFALVRDDDFLYGFVDREGRVVVPVQYKAAGNFSHGRARVKVREKHGFVDPQGEFVIDPIYDDATDFIFGHGIAKVWVGKQVRFIDTQGDMIAMGTKGARELGLTPAVQFVKKKNKYVLVDGNGKQVTSKTFDDCYGFSEGFCQVNLGAKREPMFPGSTYISLTGGLWGFLDEKGEFLVEPKFDAVSAFSEGRAAVRVGNRWGYIDRTGKMVIEPRFESAEAFEDGLAYVDYGKGETGYVDLDGNVIWRSA